MAETVASEIRAAFPGDDGFVPVGPALFDPRTKEAVVAQVRAGCLQLLGCIALVAIGLIVFAGHFRQASALPANDYLTTAIVTSAQAPAWTGPNAIVVQYSSAAQPTAAVITPDDPSDYFAGEEINVVFDPSQPGHPGIPPRNRRASDPGGYLAAAVFAIGLGALVPLWLGASWWWRLSKNPWRPYAATAVEKRKVRLVPLGDPDATPALLVPITRRRNIDPWQKAPVLWVAGDLDSTVVLATPDRQLVSAKRARKFLGRELS